MTNEDLTENEPFFDDDDVVYSEFLSYFLVPLLGLIWGAIRGRFRSADRVIT